MNKYLTIIICALMLCLTTYMCVHRVCSTIDRENQGALMFRALELGYNGEIDLFGGD